MARQIRTCRFFWLAGAIASLIPTLLAVSAHSAAAPASSGAVSFSRDLAPIFQRKCVTCHGTEKTKGGYQLHTFQNLMKGGESKEASVVPGQPERSKLFQLLVAKDADDRMPQKDDPLPAAPLALIERWIKEGAKFDGLNSVFEFVRVALCGQ